MMAMEKLDGAGQARQQAPTPARSFGLAHLEKDNYSYQQDHDDHDDVFSAEEERENQVGSIIQITYSLFWAFIWSFGPVKK